MANPAFSLPVLESVRSCWGDPVAVYTGLDRRRGRGLSKGFSEVKAFSLQKGWPVFQPRSLRDPEALRDFEGLAPDLVVVAAYGLLIPPKMLCIPKHGFLNIHPSLLPLYRGPSPVPTAILDGSERTGVSLMLLDEGLDTGPVLARESTGILPGEKADALTMRLFRMGSSLLAEYAPRWIEGSLSAEPQDAARATHTAKLTREEGRADWREDAVLLCRRFRAYTPWPGLYTHWRGKRLRLLEVEEPSPDTRMVPSARRGGSRTALSDETGVVGVLPDSQDAIVIEAGGGTRLLVRQLQLEGRRAQSAAEFLRGYPHIIGDSLPS